MTNLSRIAHQESPRDFRTEIPNVVFELLEAGLISQSDLILYSVYRRIAGEYGSCFVGTRGLEKKCHMKDQTIAQSKKNLSKKFDVLNGKSLIEITTFEKKKQMADNVTIIDIWTENHHYFKNKLTCSKRGGRGVVNEGAQERTIKKDICNDIIIAEPDPSPPPIRPDPPKTVPAGGNNNSLYKSLSNAIDLSPKQKLMLMKFPEPLVNDAIRYCYHPSTQITGGPLGRMKLLQHFLRNPDDFKETLDCLDKPKEKQSKKDTILGAYKNGHVYNGYECSIDDNGISFCKSGMNYPYMVLWKDKNFNEQLNKIIEKIGN